MKCLYIILFIFSILMASFSQILLKKGSHSKNIYLNIKTLTGYGIMFLSTLLTLYAYKGITLGFGQILQSLSFIFVIILSKIFLKEQITKKKVYGIIIIIFGIIVFYV